MAAPDRPFPPGTAWSDFGGSWSEVPDASSGRLRYASVLSAKNMMIFKLRVLAMGVGMALGTLPAEVPGGIRLAALFSDHAVLQQGKPVPVWGWGAPGDAVSVVFRGHSAQAVTDASGRWQAVLPAMLADNEPGTLTVSSGSTRLVARDVLVGEVWLCSGQSNMEWRVDQVKNANQEIAAAEYPLIRQFRVPKSFGDRPVPDVSGGWSPASPKTVGMFSGVAYFFARDLHRTLNVPIGLINASFGGKMIETFMSPEALEQSGLAAVVGKRWEDERARLPAQMAAWEKTGKGMNPGIVVAQHQPSCLFHAMLAPLAPYGIRGAIWYQGEHNISRAVEYRALFPAFIRDLRAKFGQGDFPFYFVQLANYDAKLDKSREGYPLLREAQLQTLALPATGMAVTIDIGTPENVHPVNKQDVGARLARIAKARTYGLGGVDSGPSVRSGSRENGAIRLAFDHAEGGLRSGPDPAAGFEIAGADGSFRAASVRLDGEEVVVSSPEVPEPVSVRYAWANAPEISLFNREGLPASPFRFTVPDADR